MKSKLIQFLVCLAAVLVSGTIFAVAANHVPAAFAQSAGSSGGFVPCGNTADNPCTVNHLVKGFIVIINYLITMAGFVAVAAIVYAGLLMVWSQGESGLVEAKGRFTGAIIGLVLVAAAFIIINSLLTGSVSIGVCNGGKILTDPKGYINGADCATKKK